MGLFGINNELEFLICNHGESHANSQQKWQGELFYKGEKEVGMATINGVNGFSLVELLPGRKRSHSSSCWILPSSQSMRTPLPQWSPNSIQLRFLLICNFINLLYLLICNWDFCLLFFLVLSFLVTEGTVWGQIHLLFLIAKAEFSRG